MLSFLTNERHFLFDFLTNKNICISDSHCFASLKSFILHVYSKIISCIFLYEYDLQCNSIMKNLQYLTLNISIPCFFRMLAIMALHNLFLLRLSNVFSHPILSFIRSNKLGKMMSLQYICEFQIFSTSLLYLFNKTYS